MLARPRASSSGDGDERSSPLRNLGGWFEAVLSFFGKSGPWAVLSLLMVMGIGYEAHVILTGVGANVSEYVLTSGKNIETLVESQNEAMKQRAELSAAQSLMTRAMSDAQQQIVVNGVHINELQSLMQEAYTVMKATAARREEMTQEQTELLKKLEKGIQTLNQLVLEGQDIGRPIDGPNGS